MSGKNLPGSPPPERQCQARSKRTGEQCGKWAMRDKSVCSFHGGATPRGFGLPQTTHGRYSRSVPARLSESYGEVLADPQRLELDNELAVVVARSRELLAALYGGTSDAWWLRLRDLKRRIERARRENDPDAAAEHLNAIMRMVDRGAPSGERWREWRDNAEQLKRIAESERKRRIEDHQIATIEEVLALMGAVLSVVTRHVTDERIRRAIGMELDALVSGGEVNGKTGHDENGSERG